MNSKLLMAGLATLSLTYAVPALADDTDATMANNGSGQSLQQSNNPSASTMGSANATNPSASTMGSATTTNSDMGSSNNVDGNTPDTATGDDDY